MREYRESQLLCSLQLGSFFPRFSALEHLRHSVSDGSGSFLLHPAGRVRVDVQREARTAVAEHRGDCFYVHAALQRGRGETMSQVMKSNC